MLTFNYGSPYFWDKVVLANLAPLVITLDSGINVTPSGTFGKNIKCSPEIGKKTLWASLINGDVLKSEALTGMHSNIETENELFHIEAWLWLNIFSPQKLKIGPLSGLRGIINLTKLSRCSFSLAGWQIERGHHATLIYDNMIRIISISPNVITRISCHEVETKHRSNRGWSG